MRALIVDDSMFTREYLQRMLEQMSVRCEQAVNGVEALRVLKSGSRFDVMLCDMNMPLMDGLTCVRIVREEGLCPKMRVMMVTTHIDQISIERALACGADEFLMKPFSHQGLKDKLLLMGVLRGAQTR